MIRPTLIVNRAAYTGVDAAENDAELAMRIDCEALALMAEEARRLGAAMIHYSTDYVFDGTKDSPPRRTAHRGRPARLAYLVSHHGRQHCPRRRPGMHERSRRAQLGRSVRGVPHDGAGQHQLARLYRSDPGPSLGRATPGSHAVRHFRLSVAGAPPCQFGARLHALHGYVLRNPSMGRGITPVPGLMPKPAGTSQVGAGALVMIAAPAHPRRAADGCTHSCHGELQNPLAFSPLYASALPG